VHGFFSVPTDHLNATPIIVDYFKNHDTSNMVVVAPDAGHAKRAGEFAQRLKLPIAFVDKRRKTDTEVEATAVVGEVTGKNCSSWMMKSRQARPTIQTAKVLREHGARDISAAPHTASCAARPIERLSNSDLKQVVVANTVPVPQHKQFDRLRVLSVAPLLVRPSSPFTPDKASVRSFLDRPDWRSDSRVLVN
jgi:ribose-phosphate pyrophosphokinase